MSEFTSLEEVRQAFYNVAGHAHKISKGEHTEPLKYSTMIASDTLKGARWYLRQHRDHYQVELNKLLYGTRQETPGRTGQITRLRNLVHVLNELDLKLFQAVVLSEEISHKVSSFEYLSS